MKKSGYTVSIYALMVLLGGIMGYVKVNSLVSLGAGIGFAIALVFSAWGLFKEKAIGFYSSFVLTVILLTFFAMRYLQSYKFMPAGLMCILSVFVLACLFSGGFPKEPVPKEK